MPKIVDHDEYRKEMLQKCFTLFEIKEFASVTMKEFWKINGSFYRTLMLLNIDMKRCAAEGESEKVFGFFLTTIQRLWLNS